MNTPAFNKYMLPHSYKAKKAMDNIFKNLLWDEEEKNMSIQEEIKVLLSLPFHHKEVCVEEAIYRECDES